MQEAATKEDVQGVYNLIESRRAEDQKHRDKTLTALTALSVSVSVIEKSMPSQPCTELSNHLEEHDKRMEEEKESRIIVTKTIKQQAVSLCFSLLRSIILFVTGIIFIKMFGS